MSRLALLASLPPPSRMLFGLLTLVAMLGFLAIMLAFNPAFAQAAVLGPDQVDIGPTVAFLIQYLAPAAVVVMVLLGVWVLLKLASFLGLKVSALHRAVIEAGMEKAAGYAVTRLRDHASGGIPINLKNQAVRLIVDYAMEQFPRAVKYFGKSPDDLAKMAEARLEHVLVDPEVERKSGLLVAS